MKDTVRVLKDAKQDPLYTDSELLARTLSLGKQSYFILDTDSG